MRCQISDWDGTEPCENEAELPMPGNPEYRLCAECHAVIEDDTRAAEADNGPLWAAEDYERGYC